MKNVSVRSDFNPAGFRVVGIVEVPRTRLIADRGSGGTAGRVSKLNLFEVGLVNVRSNPAGDVEQYADFSFGNAEFFKGRFVHCFVPVLRDGNGGELTFRGEHQERPPGFGRKFAQTLERIKLTDSHRFFYRLGV